MRRTLLGSLGPSLLLTLLGGLGCGGSDPPPNNNPGDTCAPACRDGFVCVERACVSACNPPCETGQRCSVQAGTARCVVATDGGATPDDLGGGVDVPAGDVGPGEDAGAPGDTSVSDTGTPPADTGVGPGMDATTMTDTGVTTDRGPADAGVDAGPCGNPTEPCCNGRACLGGGSCANNRCAAPTREMDECTSPTDCMGAQQCQGIFECAGMRGCWRCATSAGTRTFGARCANASECQSGLCSSGRCSVPCPIGAAGDTACAARGMGYRCTATYYRPTSTAPITTLGVCQQHCARNGDCPSETTCLPLLNFVTDRMDFFCAPTTRTGPIGAACDPNGASTCRSGLCLPSGMNQGFCTAPCVSDNDCTPAAPVCGPVFWITPSGGVQNARGCVPRA